jgi:hypothetical protein
MELYGSKNFDKIRQEDFTKESNKEFGTVTRNVE